MASMMAVQAQSVAANSMSANIFAGKPFEFAPRNSIARLLGSSSAVGINATVVAGGRTIIQDEPIPQSNRYPVEPDDFILEFPVQAGERIICQLRNTTAGALTANIVCKLYP